MDEKRPVLRRSARDAARTWNENQGCGLTRGLAGAAPEARQWLSSSPKTPLSYLFGNKETTSPCPTISLKKKGSKAQNETLFTFSV